MSKYIGARENEIFVGNVFTVAGIPEHLSSLKTARLGDQALDIYGCPIDAKHMLPMFIGREEHDVHHMLCMKRTFPNQKV